MMAAIQEVTFHIQLACEYNELNTKSNAYVMRRMRRTNTTTNTLIVMDQIFLMIANRSLEFVKFPVLFGPYSPK